MYKMFNTNGYCDPEVNYMVDLSGRLEKIRHMVDAGMYFTINRARQYGKTTTLSALADYLRKDYEVISLDFQTISYADFESEQNFVAAFSREILDCAENLPGEVREKLELYSTGTVREATLSVLFKSLIKLCKVSDKKIVLMIDEVDSATNNQVFTDFLAQLRAYYLKRKRTPTFQSVILAGVYDVRNIKRKIRSDEEHKTNSPWNIAADFEVDMSFSTQDIAGMLEEYEADYGTGMCIEEIAELIYCYTSGYPYLVSRICKLIDEKVAGSDEYPDRSRAWTKDGFLEAEKMIVKENNTLYQSLIGKLNDYPELKQVLYDLLFKGKPIPYVATNSYIEMASMFGFLKNDRDSAVVSNRIFETVLYNYFVSEEFAVSEMYKAGVQEKNQFIIGGHLNVRLILEKFVETFDYLYGDQDEAFLEDAGRRYFILFLKPIINGIGNYSIEPETRNSERMDLVIYYHGEQSIIEMKVWRGNAYNERGEKQLLGYLDHYHLNKGYMLSFNFNKKKEIGVKEIALGDKVLIEAVV
ncbi:MAG: AAA-like domain-containing protein [Eubacteriales bacterium]|nr:AAA-like domain-containing protein [Eubacteriales bacterium]